MEDETSRSCTIMLPEGPGGRDRRARLRGFTDSFAGGIVYALAVMAASVVAGVILVTLLTLLVVQIVERVTGASMT